MKFTFRTFSMQDSQDFQCKIPKIFNTPFPRFSIWSVFSICL